MKSSRQPGVNEILYERNQKIPHTFYLIPNLRRPSDILLTINELC